MGQCSSPALSSRVVTLAIELAWSATRSMSALTFRMNVMTRKSRAKGWCRASRLRHSCSIATSSRSMESSRPRTSRAAATSRFQSASIAASSMPMALVDS